MAALPPANTIKFQPSAKKNEEDEAKEAQQQTFQEDSWSYHVIPALQSIGQNLHTRPQL